MRFGVLSSQNGSHEPTSSRAPDLHVRDDDGSVGVVPDPDCTSALKPLAESEFDFRFRLFQSLDIAEMPLDKQKLWIKERMPKGRGQPALAKLFPKKEDRSILIQFALSERGDTGARAGGAAAVHRTPKSGVSSLTPASDTTPASAPASTHVASPAVDPSSSPAPVSAPSPRDSFVPPVPSDVVAPATPRSPMRHVAVAVAAAAALLCADLRAKHFGHLAACVAVAAALLCAVALFRRRHR
jgi:hypothetical protein